MNIKQHGTPVILIVEAIQGLRDGMKDLLTVDGYRIATAQDGDEAVDAAQREQPDLILVCPNDLSPDFLSASVRIRERAELGNEVPVVVFSIEAVAEGEEVAYENHVYVISPDNFNHLRRFLKCLLDALPSLRPKLA